MDTLITIAACLVIAAMAFLSWLTVHQAVKVMEWQCGQVIRTDHSVIPCH